MWFFVGQVESFIQGILTYIYGESISLDLHFSLKYKYSLYCDDLSCVQGEAPAFFADSLLGDFPNGIDLKSKGHKTAISIGSKIVWWFNILIWYSTVMCILSNFIYPNDCIQWMNVLRPYFHQYVIGGADHESTAVIGVQIFEKSSGEWWVYVYLKLLDSLWLLCSF